MKRTLEKLRKKEPVTIVAIGDSISVLSSLTKGHLNWFGYLHIGLADRYGDGFIYSINSSFCGAAVEPELPRLERDVLRWKPDLVIISFGTNDSGGKSALLGKFKDNYCKMVGIIRQQCGSEIFIRVPVPSTWGFGYATNGKSMLPEGAEPGQAWAGGEKEVEIYASAVVELAKELDCAYCDHYQLWQKKKFEFDQPAYNPQGLCCRYFDTVHLNDQGHLAVYRDLAPLFGLRKYFFYEEVSEI